MKIKSKLSKVTSALLAIALIIGMASADVMSVQAAQTSGVVTSSISGSLSNSTGGGTNSVIVDRIMDMLSVGGYEDDTSKSDDSYDYKTLPLEPGERLVMPVPSSDTMTLTGEPMPIDEPHVLTKEEWAAKVDNGILTVDDFGDGSFTMMATVASVMGEEWDKVNGIKITAASVPANAFLYAEGFEYLEIAGSCTSIGTTAFLGCDDLKYIKVSGNVSNIGNRAFAAFSGTPKTYVMVDGDSPLGLSAWWETANTGRELSWDNTTYDVSYTANARAAEPIPADFTVTAHYDFGKVGAYAPHIESWSAEGGLQFANATKVLDVSEYSVQNEPTDNGWKSTITINANGTSGATPIISGNLTKYISEDGDISDSPFEAKPTETPSTTPSESPSQAPEEQLDGYLTGKIMKSDKSGIPGIKIIVMKPGSADLKDQIGSTLSTDGLGNFEINLAGLNLTDSENYHIYFMKKEWNGVGPILSSDYYFYAPVSIKNDTKAVTSGTIYYNGSYQRDDFDVSTAGTSSTHGILNVLLSENVYDGDSVVEPTPGNTPTPTPARKGDWVTVEGTYVDKDGIGLSNLYVVLDSWDTYYTLPDSDGKFTIPVDDIKVHQIYFTNKDKPGSGPIFNDDYYYAAKLEQRWSNSNNPGIPTQSSTGVYNYNGSYSNWSVMGDAVTMNMKLLAYSFDGSALPYVVVTGYYIDKNRHGVQDGYIVVDDWIDYTVAAEDGSYTINIPFDRKDHYVYFTNIKKAGSSAPLQDEWYARMRVVYSSSTWISNIFTDNKKDVVIEYNKSNWNKVGDSMTCNVRLSAYEYSGIPILPDASPSPSTSPTPNEPTLVDIGEGDYVFQNLSIAYRDKTGESDTGLYIVVDDWDTAAFKTDNLGGAAIRIKDQNDHKIYFTAYSTKQTGAVNPNECFAVATMTVTGQNSTGTAYDLTVTKVDGVEVDMPLGSTLPADSKEGILWVDLKNFTKGDTPDILDPGNGDYSGDVFAVANVRYRDINNNPLEGRYVVLDNWDTFSVKTDAEGLASVKIPNDNQSHTVYVTKNETPGEGEVKDAEWVSRTLIQNKDGKIQTDGTSKSTGSVYVTNSTWKKIGDPITISFNDKTTGASPSPSPSQKPEVGIDNMVLTGLVVEFEGQEGTEFEPYIGDALTKDNFNVTAIYTYYKANGSENPVEAEYREGLDSADWKAPKLEIDGGLKITGKPQSFIISYTYKGETVDEVINLIGKDRPVALITGVLKDADGKGMSNYVVYLQDYETFTTTGPDGEFEFENVPDGTYKLYVTKSKKQSAQVGDVAENTSSWMTTTITVKDGIPSASGTKNGDGVSSANKVRNNVISFTIVYDVETIVKVRIEGTFKDSKDAAVKDQYIVLDSWDNAKTAGDGGKYSFTDVTSGTHTLYFTNKTEKGSGSMSSDGYYYVKADITIDGSTVEVKYTSYDGATCKTNIGDDGLITIDVALSAKNEEKSESDTLKNNASTTSAGSGKASVKGTITDTEGKQLSGLAAVIDSYDKSIDTGSSGTFTITGVTDGQHTLVIHNVSKSDLEKSGNVSTSGDKVLASFSITVKEGKITDKSIGTNNLSQYGFTMEDNDATLNINMSVKAEALTSPSPSASATPTVSGNSADAASGTMSLLPKTGLDYLERSGILSGLAKIVGEDSALVKALTPDEVSSSVEGNSIQRINATTIDGGASTGATVLAIVIVLLLLAGVSVGVVVVYKGKKNRYNL